MTVCAVSVMMLSGLLCRAVAGAVDEDEVASLPEQYTSLMSGEPGSPPRAELPVMMQRAFTAQPSALPHPDGDATPKHGLSLTFSCLWFLDPSAHSAMQTTQYA